MTLIIIFFTMLIIFYLLEQFNNKITNNETQTKK